MKGKKDSYKWLNNLFIRPCQVTNPVSFRDYYFKNWENEAFRWVFAYHKNLPTNEEQLRNAWRGIVSSSTETLSEWNITDLHCYTKRAFKKRIRCKIQEENHQYLLQWSQSYKKVNTEKYANKPLKIQPYLLNLNLQDARTIFHRNCYFLPCVRLNFKSDKKNKSEGYLCPDCLAIDPPVSHPDHQDSLLSCLGNSDLRVGRDMTNLKEEAAYYREIISRRTQRFGGW